MTIETQKEIERVLLLGILDDILDTVALPNELYKRAEKAIEIAKTTDVCEGEIIRQNRLAGYGKERIN